MAFVSSPSNTNEVNIAYGVSTANTQVSPASTQVSTASTQVSTDLSDATVYAILDSQPNGSQLVHKDLAQIHKDDLEEMDLKWQECRQLRNQDSRNMNQDSSRRTVNVEETDSKAMVAIDGASFDWSYMADDEVPTNMDLMAFSDSKEFQQPEFVGYGPKTSNSISKDISIEAKESPDAILVKELVSDYKLEKKTVFPTGNPHLELQEKGVIDSGCSRHMTRNMSYLFEYKETDGGYVAFGGDLNGGKITCKGKIITDTECVVLSPNFKLLDESQVLLRVPRKNMYSVDLKNVAPLGGLTYLFAKATLDESNLWHRRLGHINFKTINKLLRGNLVRGLP
nr:ribonuclease H-like domain-containing protein [Tanacetum cinerariifolium]